ncbi:Uncharacterised protein [Amycolatopsis camponoti]|uniref:Uncharacterized protein n=1 Tax=Amycolatopsis camponoti TaxID=2606593 RepID=A0A6I8M3W6_9PSEU|nr:hypothetical protein [Amycolatopsis camponoti]VVJ22699.1 Uncharacterised protein [Amycolatopsis camponoti]
MSSYTDFYLGRGEKADWIGSLRGECYPENFLVVAPLRMALTATDARTFRAAVTNTLNCWEAEHLGQAYHRELGWPWPWYSSHTSSWIITFDSDTEAVFVTVGGGIRWHRINPHAPRFPEGEDPLGPPDIHAWLRDPAAPPSVPMPLMREKPADMPIIGGDAR